MAMSRWDYRLQPYVHFFSSRLWKLQICQTFSAFIPLRSILVRLYKVTLYGVESIIFSTIAEDVRLHIQYTINPVADPGFSRGGCANPKGDRAPTYYFTNFSGKLHENEKKIGPGGGRLLHPPFRCHWLIGRYGLNCSCRFAGGDISIGNESD